VLRKLLLLSSLCLYLAAEAHIFVYHRFDDPRYPSTNTTLKELEREFTYLKTHGYKVIPLKKLAIALKRGVPIDPKWVVLTIDDGFKSFLKALPLFKKFGYPFTIFVATKPIEGKYPDFLSWKDLRTISQYGEIALHSHAHPHLCDLSDQKIIADTQKAIDLFQKHLSFIPTSYAYPYGEYNERVRKIIEKFGFEIICNQNRGAIDKTSDPKDIDRIALVGKSNLKSALHIKHLDAQWIEPKIYPHDRILRSIVAHIDPIYKKAQVYATGYGWKKVAVKDGVIVFHPNYRLKKRRVRVIIKVKDSKISTKLLVRSRYGAK